MQEEQKERRTVAEAVDAFLEDGGTSQNWSRSTRNNYAADLKRLNEQFGKVPVNQIQAEELQDYLDALTNRHGEPVTKQTYNRHHSTLRRFFAWLVKNGEIEASPMADVKRRRMQERRRPGMTSDQRKAFFGNITDLRDQVLFALIDDCEWELSDALSVNIEDVISADGTWQVSEKGKAMGLDKLSTETVVSLRTLALESMDAREGALFRSRHGRLSYSRAYRAFREYSRDIATVDGKPLTLSQLAQRPEEPELVVPHVGQLGWEQDTVATLPLPGSAENQNKEDVLDYLHENKFKGFAETPFGEMKYIRSLEENYCVEVALHHDVVWVTILDTSIEEEEQQVIFKEKISYPNWEAGFKEINARWPEIKEGRRKQRLAKLEEEK